jgi:hypothetical protein
MRRGDLSIDSAARHLSEDAERAEPSAPPHRFRRGRHAFFWPALALFVNRFVHGILAPVSTRPEPVGGNHSHDPHLAMARERRFQCGTGAVRKQRSAPGYRLARGRDWRAKRLGGIKAPRNCIGVD